MEHQRSEQRYRGGVLEDVHISRCQSAGLSFEEWLRNCNPDPMGKKTLLSHQHKNSNITLWIQSVSDGRT